MRVKLIILFSSFLFSISLSAQQEIQVRGKVADAEGEPLPGVTVVVKGTNKGTITDIDGEYILFDISGSSVLQFSFVGMSTKEVTVNNQTVINVVLEMETVGLEEVVAVGYGTQSKKTLTGAISSIKSDEILTTKSTDFVSKLQGKVAGLNIRQNTGEPGTFDHVINIRGFGSPLYIIDGVERPSGDFQRLTSDDIENITILKDASAAIYGLNAANGVVLITTKTGVDKETTFQFSSNFGFSNQQALFQ